MGCQPAAALACATPDSVGTGRGAALAAGGSVHGPAPMRASSTVLEAPKRAEAKALPIAPYRPAEMAPSCRTNATSWPPASTTATFSLTVGCAARAADRALRVGEGPGGQG